MQREYFSEIPSDLFDYVSENPLAYAAYRVLSIQSINGDLSGKTEIPYIESVLFPFVLFSYILLKRTQNIFTNIIQRGKTIDALPSSAHVFVLSTTAKYRTYPLTAVASNMKEKRETALLCSPSTESRQKEWESEGHRIIRHTDLHGYVAIVPFLQFIFKAIWVAKRTSEVTPDKTNIRGFLIAYNYLLLEYVKYKSIQPIFRNKPTIHTQSPMPYLIEAGDTDQIYVYQHGTQWKSANYLMAVPYYVPLTYFLWSDLWKESFEDASHPESTFVSIGSPWYDKLFNSQNSEEGTFDVLFLSHSHGYNNPTKKKKYTQLVEEVISACEALDLDLKIKLHPQETEEWYSRHGSEEYIEEFDDIDTALKQARVAITDQSSAFVESSVIGTPIIVTDVLDTGLQSLAPVDNVIFIDELDDISRAITDGLNRDFPKTDRRLVDIGNSAENIASYILNSEQKK